MAAPGAHRDPARLVETIRREGVTTLHFVPSMLQAFIEHVAVEDSQHAPAWTSLRRRGGIFPRFCRHRVCHAGRSCVAGGMQFSEECNRVPLRKGIPALDKSACKL
jgi:non-ribosomal peptide synthetase component F